MCLLRPLLLGFVVCAVLVGCGGSGASPPARTPGSVAMAGGGTISPHAIQQYMNYALRFYSWVDSSQPGDGTTSCSTRSNSTACTTLRRQVLRRLREEQVVENYAAQQGIRLTAADASRVERELERLRAPQSATAKLFTTEGVSPAFMRTVLQNQILVKHVESAVVKEASLTGPSFHLRKYIFGTDRKSYKSAIDLATGGGSNAPGRTPPTHWVAEYRLTPRVRSLIQVAGDGDYVGPTRERSSYVVYQVLGRGNHRFGLPARQQIMARSFEAWLARRMENGQPKCVAGSNQTAHCRGVNH